MNVIQRDRRYRRDGRVRPSSRRLARPRVRTPRLPPLSPLSLSLLHMAPPLLALGCKNRAPAVFLGPLFLAVGAPPKNPPRPPDEPPRPPPPPISRRASANRARCSRFAAGGVLRRADTRIAPTRRVAAGALFVRRPGGPTAAEDPRRVPEETRPPPRRSRAGGAGAAASRAPARRGAAGECVLEHLFAGDALVVEGGLVRTGEDDVGEVFASVVVQAARPGGGVAAARRGFGSAESSARANAPFQGPIRRVPEAPRRADRSAGVLGRIWRGGVVAPGRAREGRRGKTHGAWRCDRRAGSAPIGAVRLVLDEGSEDGVSMCFVAARRDLRRGEARGRTVRGIRERSRHVAPRGAGNEISRWAGARSGRAARETRAHLPLRPPGRARVCSSPSRRSRRAFPRLHPARARSVCVSRRAIQRWGTLARHSDVARVTEKRTTRIAADRGEHPRVRTRRHRPAFQTERFLNARRRMR